MAGVQSTNNDAFKDSASTIGHGVGTANNLRKKASSAVKGAKIIKAGPKAIKSAVTTSIKTSLLSLKLKLIIAGSVFGIVLLISLISNVPALIGNSSMHLNDVETLSAGGDINYAGAEEEDVSLMNTEAEKARDVVREVLQTAHTKAKQSLFTYATRQNWTVKPNTGDQVTDQTTDESMVMLCAAYSASVHNMATETSDLYFTQTSAMNDLKVKLAALQSVPSTQYPFGNAIIGADFARDANGDVIIEEIEHDSMADDGTKIVVIEYCVTPVIYNMDMDSVVAEAFHIDMLAPYEPESGSPNTYADVIIDMSGSIGTMLFGEQFWENSDIYWAGAIGVPNDNIVNTARSQVGNIGGQPYWSWFGFQFRVEWCACFVSWCAHQGGYIRDNTIPLFALCSDGSNWFKNEERWKPRRSGYTPKAGDIIFFDWSEEKDHGRNGDPDHVGIVVGVMQGRVHTIEGNSNDQCKEKSYPLADGDILGYGVPNYPTSKDKEADTNEK